eukprot:SAG22_NODE_5199_length_1063_cov_1.363071_1_plen_27_part_10
MSPSACLVLHAVATVLAVPTEAAAAAP